MRLITYLSPGYPAELFEAIADHIGAELSFEVGRSGPDPAADPFAAGLADIGWVCSTSLVELTTGRPASVQEVGVAWVPDDVDASGRPVYFSDVVVRADHDAACLADLAGARIGCNDQASLSGYHALRIELDRRGHNADDFADLVMTGGHHRSIDQLLAGDLDGAVVDSIVRIGRARQSNDAAGLRVIERLGPWPTQPVVMRIDASPDDVVAVREALLCAALDPDIADLLAASALIGLAATAPDHCDGVRSAMASLAKVTDSPGR